jgi:hypothetical protein
MRTFLLSSLATSAVATLPASYTATTGTVMNQGGCGSCYADAAAQVYSDRFTGGPYSPQTLVSCMYMWQSPAGSLTAGFTPQPNGCGGGDPFTATDFIIADGIQTLSSTLYVSGDTTAGPGNFCNAGDGWDSSPDDAYCNIPTCTNVKTEFTGVEVVSQNYGNGLQGELQTEIYNNGPVFVSALTWSDDNCFTDFWGRNFNKQGEINVYTDGWCEKNGYQAPAGGHVVSMVGWGTTSGGIDYWVLKNQFGKGFGNNGFFYIERGYNTLNVENRIGFPKASSRRKLGNATAVSPVDNITQVIVGGWRDDDLNSTRAMHAATHLANKTSDTITVMLVAKKQNVAGTNHHVVFEAVAPDGTTHTHTAVVWKKLDDTLVVQYHTREPKQSEWASPGAIAGLACAGVALVAAMAAVVRKKRAAAAGATPAEDANAQAAVAADATNAL